MKRILPILIAIFWLCSSYGQQLTPPCGFDEVYNRQMATEPGFSINVESLNKQIYDIIQREKQSNGHLKAGTLVTIPMVFHVIHLGEAVGTGTNISDAQVESAVRGLNVNYRNNKNWGTSNPSAPFNPNGVDLEVEFCLAKRAPNGQPTTGITRVKGDIFSEYMDKGCINNSSVGTVNEAQIVANQGWDKNKYYNVYVVAEINNQGGGGSGNVGYAYFPGGGTDGTVIIWKSTGYCGAGDPCPFKNTSLVAPYDNGTMVHEMGHAFALQHTFHDKGQADLSNSGGGSGQPIASCNNANESASQCATSGDMCCDTQRHLGNLGTCPTAGSTMNECLGIPYDVKTASNVMNYTNCTPKLFTADQRDRIKATLSSNTTRKNLAASDACNSVYPYDIALTKISQPGGYYCNSSVGGVITVKNMGGNEITSFTLEILVDGIVTGTSTWTGNLASNTEGTVNVDAINASSGNHTYELRVVAASLNNNTQTDGLASNNTISTSFEVISNGAIVTLTADDYADGDNLVIKTTSGTTVKTVTLGNYNGVYTEGICLPPGCYDFIMTDVDYQPLNYGAGEMLVPAFSVKDDHGYELASGIADQYASTGAEIGIPKTETSYNKCLPYNPGYIDADFMADKFVLTAGTSVKFTDLTTLSSGSPATAPDPNDWNWDFGDGFTSTQQHPNHAYNTPGVYTVVLTANNGIAPSTANKLHYIRVIPAITGCDKLDNFIAGETPVFKSTVNGVAGYYPGPNVAKPSAYAERFFTPTTGFLKSIDLFVGYFRAASPTSEVTISVHSNSNNVPGPAVSVTKFPMTSLVMNNYTNIKLTNPLNIVDFFYIVVQINPTHGDTLVLGSSDYRAANDYSNTAYALISGAWKPISTAFTTSGPSSLAISANLSVLPKAHFESDVIQICSGKSVNYTSNQSTSADAFEWLFDGGSPSTSATPNPTVTYNTEGVKNIQLVVHGGCGESDTLVKTISVNPLPTVTIEVTDEVCNKSNGSALAKPAGGSGDFAYNWSSNPPQFGVKATNLPMGNYILDLVDSKCGSISKSFVINNLNKLADYTVDVNHTTCGENNGSAIAYPVGGSGTYSYKWTKLGDPSFSQGGRTAVNLSPGTYTVEVQDGTCNPNEQTITINGSDPVFGGVSASQTQICEGESVVLAATGGTNYTWSINGNTISNDQTFTVAPSTSTDYKVHIVDDRGCFADLKQYVVVTMAPQAYAKVSKQNGVQYTDSTTVDMANGGYAFFSSSGSVGNSYLWSFGDASTSTIKNPFHQYTIPGLYQVTLEVTIEDCKTTDYSTVNVISSVGIDRFSKLNLTVFPNPSTGKFTLINHNQVLIKHVQVYDIVGKELTQINGDELDAVLDLSFLSAGSYTLRFVTDQGDSLYKIDIVK